MLPLSEVQTALYSALTPALAPVPVLDESGPNEEFPYVTLGEFIGEQSDTLRDLAVDIDVTIHCWSRQPGMQQIQQLMQQIKNTLHGNQYEISGAQWVTTVWQYAQTLREPDGVTRHGVLRFRIQTFRW